MFRYIIFDYSVLETITIYSDGVNRTSSITKKLFLLIELKFRTRMRLDVSMADKLKSYRISGEKKSSEIYR